MSDDEGPTPEQVRAEVRVDANERDGPTPLSVPASVAKQLRAGYTRRINEVDVTDMERDAARWRKIRHHLSPSHTADILMVELIPSQDGWSTEDWIDAHIDAALLNPPPPSDTQRRDR